jgi:hypothetical protein
MNAVGIEENVGENLLFPPQGSLQVQGPRSLKSGNKDEFRQNEVRPIEYDQSSANMNQRQVSTPACLLSGRTGHYYSVCNTYPNMQPRVERCQQCKGQHLEHPAIRVDPRYSNPRDDRSGEEMSSIEETFLMVVISTITTRDTLETLTGQMATLEGKKTNPLISLETNLVLAHTMQTSKKD